MYLIVAVRAGALSGTSYPADDLTPFDLFSGMNFYPEHVPEEGGIAIAIINDYMVAITVARVAGDFDGSIGGRVNGGTLRGGKVETCVEFCGFIDGVDPVSKSGCDTAEVFVADWLDGGGTGKQLFLVLNKPIDLGIGFSLVGDPVGQQPEGICDGSVKIFLVHTGYQLELLLLLGGMGAGAVGDWGGFENGAIDIVVPLFQLAHLLLQLLYLVVEHIIIILQGFVALHQPFLVSGREIFIGDRNQDQGSDDCSGQKTQHA